MSHTNLAMRLLGSRTKTPSRYYFDNAARTVIHPVALQTLSTALKQVYGNPSASYLEGITAHDALYRARESIAELVGCKAEEMLFTSCGTESNNLVLRAACLNFKKKYPRVKGVIIISSVEHPSISKTAIEVGNLFGYEVVTLPVMANGLIHLDAFVTTVTTYKDRIAIMSIIHGQNEVGVCQDIRMLVKMAREIIGPSVPIHSDMTQVFGKVTVDLTTLGVSFATGSAHKFHGPPGVGLLYINKEFTHIITPETSTMSGGGQESGSRSGTENVPGILATEAALRVCVADKLKFAHIEARLRDLKEFIWVTLRKKIQGLQLNSILHNRYSLPNIISLTFPAGYHGHIIAQKLDESKNIAINSGSACSKNKKGSVTLLSMGRTEDEAHRTIRISMSSFTTPEEVSYLCKSIIEVYYEMASEKQK